jgi:hypothetical protein
MIPIPREREAETDENTHTLFTDLGVNVLILVTTCLGIEADSFNFS